MNIGAHRIFSITLTCAHARPVSKLCAKLHPSKLSAKVLLVNTLCCIVMWTAASDNPAASSNKERSMCRLWSAQGSCA